MTEESGPRRPDFQLLNMRTPAGREALATAEQRQERGTVDALEEQVGHLFVDEHDGRFLFDNDRGQWMIWTGATWAPDQTMLALDTMLAFTRRLAVGARTASQRAKFAGVGFNKNCLIVAGADRRMSRKGADFNSEPNLVGTPEGYIDLETGKHHDPDPSKLISLSTKVSPAETSDCPEWKKFLKWATAEDADLQRYLQKYFGYCLSGYTHEEILTFIYGTGGNGKGVVRHVIGRVMGDYYVSSPSSTFMVTKHQEHSTELARLQHRRLVSASETNEGDKWNMARIKDLTGNESEISARFMREDFFDFWPVFKLMIIGNIKPSFDDVDPAITRRLRLIHFMQRPAVIDNQLKTNMQPEYPAILRWMVEGYQIYKEEGLDPPQAIKMASAAYLGDQDATSQFLREWTESRKRGVLLKSDIGLAVGIWARDNGITKKIPATRVYKHLDETTGLEHGDSVRHDGRRCYRGINLNELAWKAIRKELEKDNKKLDDKDECRGIR
jgi:putative DNA primase/helicase